MSKPALSGSFWLCLFERVKYTKGRDICMKYDLIIVGAGPAGIFTAMELIKKGSRKKILMIEKGKPVEKRRCPKAEVGHCVNCKNGCDITTGFSGAGAFSDGKLSLSYEVGGDLPSLIGVMEAQELIRYTDEIYLEFGADPRIEGVGNGEEIKEIRKNAIKAGLKLVDCPIRHLGTEHSDMVGGARGGNVVRCSLCGYSAVRRDLPGGNCPAGSADSGH